MNTHTRNYLLGALAIVIILAAAFIIFRPRIAAAPGTTNATTTTATSSVLGTSSTGTMNTTGVSATDGHGAIVINDTAPAPADFATPLKFPSSIDASAQAAITAQFNTDIAAIKKTNDVNAWGDLAVLRKMVQDYSGSAEIWVYLTQRYPAYSGPYASLGDLYANYLKNYPKADAAYLQSIKLNPKDVDVYLDLYYLYTGAYPKSATAAEDILKQGIKANPTSYQLQLQLAEYYAAKGRTVEAKAEYALAAKTATNDGKADVAAQIQADAAKLQ